jgi:hypothetical protein
MLKLIVKLIAVNAVKLIATLVSPYHMHQRPLLC